MKAFTFALFHPPTHTFSIFIFLQALLDDILYGESTHRSIIYVEKLLRRGGAKKRRVARHKCNTYPREALNIHLYINGTGYSS